MRGLRLKAELKRLNADLHEVAAAVLRAWGFEECAILPDAERKEDVRQDD